MYGGIKKSQRSVINLNKPKLFMLVGLPGSGKSQEALLLQQEHGAVICSSNAIREEINGDANNQANPQKVFDLLHNRIIHNLIQGKNVIYDATNISSKRRNHFLKSVLKDMECQKIAIIMATPYEQCLINNSQRERKVPEDVIRKMYMSWQTPYYYEGFDVIQIVLWQGEYDTPYDWMKKHLSFDQKNSHHKLSLGQHSAIAYKSIRSSCDELYYAALLHDCGKPFTQVFVDSKGNPTTEAHYYQHANVGAYDSFFYMSNTKSADSLLTSWLIEKHMEMYQCEKNKPLEEKRRNLWGDEFYGLLGELHRVDKEAH